MTISLRIDLNKLECTVYSLPDCLTDKRVSPANKRWVQSFSSKVSELRVYTYRGHEIGAIVDEVADIDTIKEWLTEFNARKQS